MAIGNTMPAMYKGTSAGKFILDLAFRDCALILSESKLIYSEKANQTFPLPLVGFSFDTPENIGLMDFSYCEYPYLNKTMIVNALVKNNTSIIVKAYRPIIRSNPIILNMITNMALIKTLETYVMRGGTFTLNTMWGVFPNLVLEKLDGINTQASTGGVGFQFTLKMINFANMDSTATISQSLTKLAGGGI